MCEDLCSICCYQKEALSLKENASLTLSIKRADQNSTNQEKITNLYKCVLMRKVNINKS